MELVKIGSLELSTGAKKSSQVCGLENRGFGQKFPTNIRKIWICLFSSGENSAGAHNKRLGPRWFWSAWTGRPGWPAGRAGRPGRANQATQKIVPFIFETRPETLLNR